MTNKGKSIQLTGICNPLVDILLRIEDDTLNFLEAEKGTMRLVDNAEQAALLKKLNLTDAKICSGGSVANSIVSFAELGGTAGLIGALGADTFGGLFTSEIDKNNISLGAKPREGATTGTCISLITPDSERTLRTHLGEAAELDPEHVNHELIQNSEWLFIEGFPLINGDKGRSAIRDAVETAKKFNTKIAVTCSEPIVVALAGDDLRAALSASSLLFANEEEAKALSQQNNITDAFNSLSNQYPGVVVTAGPAGSHVFWNGKKSLIPAFKSTPIDLTGAGDMFAAGFLFGIISGLSADESARRGSFLAKQVIEQIGARLSQDLKKLWQSVPN